MSTEPVKILFVCLGNICRSPSAEAVARAKIEAKNLQDRIEVASAGTGAWHVGKSPDERARAEAEGRGYSMAGFRAAQVSAADFFAFDHIVAMDHDNLAELQDRAPADGVAQLSLLMDHAPHLGRSEVPDPYYGGRDGFSLVLDMIEAGVGGLLKKVK